MRIAEGFSLTSTMVIFRTFWNYKKETKVVVSTTHRLNPVFSQLSVKVSSLRYPSDIIRRMCWTFICFHKLLGGGQTQYFKFWKSFKFLTKKSRMFKQSPDSSWVEYLRLWSLPKLATSHGLRSRMKPWWWAGLLGYQTLLWIREEKIVLRQGRGLCQSRLTTCIVDCSCILAIWDLRTNGVQGTA